MQNTNLAGKQKAPFGLRQIRGIGRRFAIVTLKIAGVSQHKRTGELNEEEIKAVSDIIARPTDYNIPKWFLNRQKDPKDGGYTQLISNNMDTAMREDLERMRKAKQHRGLRHFWGHKVRGQRTKSTGRCGKTLGVQRKK
jgi:small subunit ribosomal protein S18e